LAASVAQRRHLFFCSAAMLAARLIGGTFARSDPVQQRWRMSSSERTVVIAPRVDNPEPEAQLCLAIHRPQ